MGDISLVLGTEVTRDRQNKKLIISQENYTKSIIETFGTENFKSASTPGYGPELFTKQPEESFRNLEETQRHRAITGSVMNLAQITTFDIMYSTCQLARAIWRPSEVHMGAAEHFLKYLQIPTVFTLVYRKGGLTRTSLSDSNWGNNPDNGKSTSCCIMMFCKAPVGFGSGVQSLTALSAIEAELVEGVLAMREAVF